jgi:hypothetical protein
MGVELYETARKKQEDHRLMDDINDFDQEARCQY